MAMIVLSKNCRFLFVHEGGAVSAVMTSAQAVAKWGQHRIDRPGTEHLFMIDGDTIHELDATVPEGKTKVEFSWIPVTTK